MRESADVWWLTAETVDGECAGVFNFPPDPAPIPEGAMRVAPGSDAVVWRINSDSCGEL